MATNLMAASGCNNVYNITDGFEGDKVQDEVNVYFGKRMVNGWKNSRSPWTYSLDPELIKLSDTK